MSEAWIVKGTFMKILKKIAFLGNIASVLVGCSDSAQKNDSAGASTAGADGYSNIL
jgi:hypothetical protein